MKWNKWFLIFSVTCLGLQILGASISIAFSMPAQVVFGGQLLSPENATPALVAKEFLSKGTALAPPLLLIIIYSVFLFLSSRKGIIGVIGTILLIIIGILFTVATQGEYANPDRFPNMPEAIYLSLLIFNNIFTVGVSLLGMLKLVTQAILTRRKNTINIDS